MTCGKPLRLDTLGSEAAPPVSSPGPTQTVPPVPATGPAMSPPAPKAAVRSTRRSLSLPAGSFHIFNIKSLFGIVDVLIVLGLVIWLITSRLGQQTSGCPPLKVPEEARVADSRDAVSGNISGFLVLQAGQTYDFNGVVTVAEEATLQIEPGARLLFDQGSRLDVNGMIHACGSRADPVVFTSNRDGAETGPSAAAGDWQGIRFHDSSSDTSVLSQVQIRFAGSDNHPALYIEAASPMLADVRIADAAAYPLSADIASAPRFSGDLTLDNNAVKGMEIRGGELYGNARWEGSQVVRVVTGNITVKDSGRLTIEPGLVLKFVDDTGLDVEGTLVAVGGRGSLELNDGKTIVFTGVRDDEAAGDTDLHTAESNAGDWRGISFLSSNTNTSLENAVVRYAGRGGRAAVYLESSSPGITEVLVEHAPGYAISSDAASTPQIKDLSLKDIALGGGWEIRGGMLSGRETYRWSASGKLARVISGDLTVDREATLVIERGVLVRFGLGTGLYVDGTLEVAGDTKNQVIFSSVRDDAEDVGGDVDGSDARPVEGDWRGVWYRPNSNDQRSAVRFALMRYAETGLGFDAVSPTVENLTVERSSAAPIRCENGAQPTFTNITLHDNAENPTCVVP